MIEVENLRAASAYVCNQLLARGLIDCPIEFVAAEPDEVAVILRVINDLILRKDVNPDPVSIRLAMDQACSNTVDYREMQRIGNHSQPTSAPCGPRT